MREGLGTFGREMGRVLRRRSRQVAVTVEERPDLGPAHVDLPSPLPTRSEPMALALLYGAGLTLVVSLTLVGTSLALTGQVPPTLVRALVGVAVILGIAGNLTVIARPIKENATETVRPMVGAGIPASVQAAPAPG